MALSISSGIRRAGDWVFRRSAMREARRHVLAMTPARERAVNQAALLIEVARRVAEPVEALPKGSRPAVLAALYRDAAYWVLRATDEGETDPPGLATLWEAAAPEKLVKAAGGEEALAVVRGLLLDQSPAGALAASDDAVAHARAFAESLLWDLDAPNRAIERIHVQRWTRIAALAVLCVAAFFGLDVALRGPNLAKAKVFKTSSAYAPCMAPNKCFDVLLHTLQEDNPWADFDLGSVKTIRRVDVTNRSDCCPERAVPLIVEISVDDKRWIQVARRDTAFSTWTATFPKQRARYVRLRIPKPVAILNLDDVAIR